MKFVAYMEDRPLAPGPRIRVGAFEKESEKTITVVSTSVGGQYLEGNGRIPKGDILAICDDLERLNKALVIQRLLLNQTDTVIKAVRASYTENIKCLIENVRKIGMADVSGEGKIFESAERKD